jgi:phospholipid transport system substrate-binding protein
MRISESAMVSRRTAVLALGAVALAVRPRIAAADASSEARGFVAALADELQRLVNSGRGEAQMYSAFEAILARYGDMPAVAASVLGPPWREASSAQKQAFVGAFQTYLARKYGRQFREYQNARIEVLGARDGGRAGVLVQTRVVRPGKEDVAVDWQVSNRSGAPKVVNLIIEGVSLLASERAQIGAILEAQRGSLDGLIAQLRAYA